MVRIDVYTSELCLLQILHQIVKLKVLLEDNLLLTWMNIVANGLQGDLAFPGEVPIFLSENQTMRTEVFNIAID